MATVITRYVVSGLATGAADGTSAVDAWSTIANAIIGIDTAYASGLIAADVQIDLMCSNPSTVIDNTTVIINTIVDATRFIRIIQDGSVPYTLREATTTNTFSLQLPQLIGSYFELIGNGLFDVSRDFNTNSGSPRSAIDPRKTSNLIDGIFCKQLGTGNTGTGNYSGIRQNGFSGITSKVTNSVFKDFGNSLNGNGIAAPSSNVESINNTYDNCDDALDCNAVKSRNDIFQNNTNDVVTDTTDTNYRLTDSATVIGANDVLSTTLTFIDAANDDYHLAVGDTAAEAVGVGPSTDSDVPTADAEGFTRSGATTDVGAYLLDQVLLPTLTGPDTATVDATRTVTGTALDTATTAGLKTVGYSKTLTITPINTTSLSQVDAIDSGIALGTPVASLPVEADVLAAGATAWQIQQWVDDGVNPEVARNITLNYLAAHTTVQAMIATANTTPGESLQATNIIAVEDDMQHSGPNVVDTVTITRAADGTLTTDKDQTISFTERYWSPSTGQASYASITVKGSAILGGTGGEGATNLHYVNRTQFYIN